MSTTETRGASKINANRLAEKAPPRLAILPEYYLEGTRIAFSQNHGKLATRAAVGGSGGWQAGVAPNAD